MSITRQTDDGKSIKKELKLNDILALHNLIIKPLIR